MSPGNENIATVEVPHHVNFTIAKNEPKQSALHFPVEDQLAHTKSMNEVIRKAKTATDKEHKMTLWQGIKLYPKAIGWSLLISTCICMEGYDGCLLSSFCEYLGIVCDGIALTEVFRRVPAI